MVSRGLPARGALTDPSRPRSLAVVAAAAAVAYAWWAAVRPPFSASAHVAVLSPAAAILGFGLWQGRRAPARRAAAPGALVLWGAFVAVVVGWELVNYFQHPRHDHPTLSSLLDTVDHEALRRLFFMAWLGLGWSLAQR